MLQKPWFKVFIWFIAIGFLFLTSGVLISEFRPGPSEIEVMKFMEGMMGAMDRSIMGAAMNLEHDRTLMSIIAYSAKTALPLIIAGLGLGLGIRLLQRRV